MVTVDLQGHPGLDVAPSVVAAGAPRVFYLWWADGGPLPVRDSICATGTPAAFSCNYDLPNGKSLTNPDQCKSYVQTFLNKWYASFNIIFTWTKPTSGTYDTEIITT